MTEGWVTAGAQIMEKENHLMPQPLTQRFPKGVSMHDAPFAETVDPQVKDMLRLVMECIGTWSRNESMMLKFYVELAGGNKEDAALIYLSMERNSAKSALIRVLSSRRMDDEERELLSAVQAVTSSLAKSRNRFCHWTWSVLPDYPQYLVAVDPVVAVRETPDFSTRADDEWDFMAVYSGSFLYTGKELGDLLASFRLVGLYWLLLYHHILRRGSSIYDRNEEHSAFRDLSNYPAIAEALQRIRKKSQ